MKLRNDQRQLLIATAITFGLWFVPFGGIVGLPLIYLNTHLHEFFHAVSAVATGGSVQHILVFGSGGGVTPVAGGFMVLVASAGYVGCAAVGALMIWTGRTERGARRLFGWLGALLAISMILWVRGDVVGFIAGLLWAVAFIALAKYGKGDGLVLFAQFLGVQQCVAGFTSILVLYKITTYGGEASDAALAEQFTGIPAVVWAIGWALIGSALAAVTLRAAWQNHPESVRR